MPELAMGTNALHKDPAEPEPEDARQMVKNAEMRLRKRQVCFPNIPLLACAPSYPLHSTYSSSASCIRVL
jgi:hypothetical protein